MPFTFNDDEEPPAISSAGGPPKPSVQADRVRLVAYHNKEAPLEQNMQQVLLQVMDTSPSAVERSGLDLVAVLDISGSMGNDRKLERLKTAMKFVISKLGPVDRLSIVSFSNNAYKWCGLHCMTQNSKEKLKNIVENELKADGYTNMEEGLETGLKVLAGRRHKMGRVGSVILMSDGEQGPEGDATKVVIDRDVPVYTFGFGAGKFAKVLATVASNSRGGTFYYMRDGDGESVSEHFSQLMAGLLSVVVRDLELTVWQQRGHSEIRKVDAGGYLDDPWTPVDQDGKITVRFGDLYAGEGRKVVVDLMLPPVGREYRETLLFAQCWYSVKGQNFYTPREYLRCIIRRTRRARPDAVAPEVKVELVRGHYARTLREASELDDLDSARHKLQEAKKHLDDAEQSTAAGGRRFRIIGLLRDELMLFLRLATWAELLAALLAAWTSHNLQRYAAKGDVWSVPFYETERMVRYKKEAAEFDRNPDMTVSTAEEDVVKEEEATATVRPVMPGDHHLLPTTTTQPRIWGPSRRHRTSGTMAWRAVIFLCTVLAIALIVAGAAVFAVYLLYKPKTPYLMVSDARLGQLQYAQDGTVQYLQASVTVVAANNNSKADASFSGVDLALAFHGAEVALLRAADFVVPRECSLPLRYEVVSAGQALDPDGMRAMDEALKAGVVPLDLVGKARTRWKVGVFVHLKFWTRVNCRLRFFFPGNGTVMATDRQKCRSRSP